MRECPYCKEEVKEGAIRCKHCHASIGENGETAYAENDEGVKYLENGFGKYHYQKQLRNGGQCQE